MAEYGAIYVDGTILNTSFRKFHIMYSSPHSPNWLVSTYKRVSIHRLRTTSRCFTNQSTDGARVSRLSISLNTVICVTPASSSICDYLQMQNMRGKWTLRLRAQSTIRLQFSDAAGFCTSTTATLTACLRETPKTHSCTLQLQRFRLMLRWSLF